MKVFLRIIEEKVDPCITLVSVTKEACKRVILVYKEWVFVHIAHVLAKMEIKKLFDLVLSNLRIGPKFTRRFIMYMGFCVIYEW